MNTVSQGFVGRKPSLILMFDGEQPTVTYSKYLYIPNSVQPLIMFNSLGTHMITICSFHIFIPLLNEVEGSILVSPCPSVCPYVDRIVSALYLLQYSPNPFLICTVYQATSKGVLCVQIFLKIQKIEVLANSLNL